MLNINKFDLNKFNLSELIPVQVVNGSPDLTVWVEASRYILRFDSQSQLKVDSLVITFTVENRLRFTLRPPSVSASGSDVKDVMLKIQLSSGLQQVGGMAVPAGFQAAVTPDHHTVICFGGAIPAGGSVVFAIEVVDEHISGFATILAEVDPYNFIAENLENNNTGSAIIQVKEITAR